MKFGNSEIFVFNDGTFTLDTGAAFGIVPRNVWHKKIQPNPEGRVMLQSNIPVIINEDRGYILDTGLGSNPDPSKKKWFQIDKSSDLNKSIQAFDLEKKITHILHSHMHFDHIGHTFEKNTDGNFFLKDAIPIINNTELKNFRKPNEFTRGSYNQWNSNISRRKKKLIFGSSNLVGGMKIIQTSGHTSGHTAFIFESSGNKLIYFGDLIPTTFHLKPGYLTAMDTYPMETVKFKKKLVKQAINGKYLCLFSHDIDISAAYLTGDESNPEIEKVSLTH
ncbi:MAG: MBL fold metallo-hydrolase [Thermoplasmataceae archaeon]